MEVGMWGKDSTTYFIQAQQHDDLEYLLRIGLFRVSHCGSDDIDGCHVFFAGHQQEVLVPGHIGQGPQSNQAGRIPERSFGWERIQQGRGVQVIRATLRPRHRRDKLVEEKLQSPVLHGRRNRRRDRRR